jgi:hypothetical protein
MDLRLRAWDGREVDEESSDGKRYGLWLSESWDDGDFGASRLGRSLSAESLRGAARPVNAQWYFGNMHLRLRRALRPWRPPRVVPSPLAFAGVAQGQLSSRLRSATVAA